MIDTHAHLTDERLVSQIEAVLARASEAGVDKILVPATGLLDGKKAIELADKYEVIWAMVGVHPESVSEKGFHGSRGGTRDEFARNDVEELVRRSNKVVGIGEIGLDFYYDKEKRSKELQMRVFQEQLELAVKMNVPVVIHMREAEAEMTEILSQLDVLPKGQFHCWAGGDDLLKLVLEKGFYVSFCGNITYKSAENLRNLAKLVPLDRLLLETDSPYLAPEGRRGSLNEPANVKIIAEYIAKLLDVSPETLINQTTENAKCLFFGG
ncbi:MAG: TatD family hydrolase [Microgenomates group bacterium]